MFKLNFRLQKVNALLRQNRQKVGIETVIKIMISPRNIQESGPRVIHVKDINQLRYFTVGGKFSYVYHIIMYLFTVNDSLWLAERHWLITWEIM